MGRSGCKIGGPVPGTLVSTTRGVAKSSPGAKSKCARKMRFILGSGVRRVAAKSEGLYPLRRQGVALPSGSLAWSPWQAALLAGSVTGGPALQQGATQTAQTGATLKPIRKSTNIRAKNFDGLTSMVAFNQSRIIFLDYCKLYASCVKRESFPVDRSGLRIGEAFSDFELWLMTFVSFVYKLYLIPPNGVKDRVDSGSSPLWAGLGAMMVRESLNRFFKGR